MAGASVTIDEAENRLGSLLERVAAGEEFLITQHGAPIARLVPVDQPRPERARAALAAIQRLRMQLQTRGVRVTQDEVRDWKNEGRR